MLAHKNGHTNALIRTMLFCRKFYGARPKFDKIAKNRNNVSRAQMLSICAIILKLGFIQA